MLVNLKEILSDARKNNYAVGCINTPNVETLKAVIAAAEEVKAPIVIDHAEVHDSIIPLESIAPYMIEHAKKAKVPVCVHLDHGVSYSFVMRAIRQGFTSIMYDCSALPFEENVRKVQEFVKIARDLNITVEGELGMLPSGDDDTHEETHALEGAEYYTDPDQAVEFAERTRVDALAINFGTAHGIYKAAPKLDTDRAKKIVSGVREDCSVVMHGASGVDEEQITKAINSGISKINYYTYMSTAVAPKIVEMINNSTSKVYYHDIALFAQKTMTELCIDVISLFMNGKKANF